MRTRLRNDAAILAQPGSKRDYNRALFATVAPRYHLVTRLMSLFRDAAWKRFLMSQLPAVNDGPVVDIATGTGDLLTLARRRWPTAAVVGCDISPAMLSQVGCAADEATMISCQDMGSLAIGSGRAAVITGSYALRNAPDIRATLAECFRVLMPGGAAGFLDFSRSPNAMLFFAQYWTLRLWGGLWGILLHGNPAVYAYIAESLRLFPDRNALRRALVDAGFAEVFLHRRMLGIIDVIIARRPHLHSRLDYLAAVAG